MPPARPTSPLAAATPVAEAHPPIAPDRYGSMPLGLEGYCPVTLADRGVWTEGQVEQLAVGLAGFIAVACYALWKRYKDRITLLTALETPAGATEAEVVAKVNAGLGASVSGGK